MEACTGFERCIGIMLNPVACVAEQHAELHWNVVWVNPDVLSSLTKLSGPFPDVAEETTMEIQHELLSQYICLAPPSEPEQSAFDIGLFQLVEFIARGDVLEFQTFNLVGVERRRALRFVTDDRHLSSQKSAGMVRTSSFAILSTSALFFSSGSDWRSSAICVLAFATKAWAFRRACAAMASSTRPPAGTIA